MPKRKNNVERNIKLVIQYDGTRYNGWQRKPGDDKTIQYKLENVISRMLGEEVLVIGSGRTDKGVHALMQVANFHSSKKATFFTCDEMLDYINSHLPQDIAVISLTEADSDFHARFNCKSKTYLYRIDNRPVQDVFQNKFRTHIRPDLDIREMKKAIKYFVGKNDFTAFTSNKIKNKNNVREIFSVEIITHTGNNGFIDIEYIGNGFLYNMARIMTGTLLEIGLHKRKTSDIPAIFEGGERAMAGYTAPPEGLVLTNIEY